MAESEPGAQQLEAVSAPARGTPTAQVPAPRGPSLFQRLLIANGLVFVLIVLLLSVTPITITAPIIRPDELLFVLAGTTALFGVEFLLLRRVLFPLRRLTELMATIDPDRPGRRLDEVSLREGEVAELAGAFNRMLDRLEDERRESARVALAAQEQERSRVARELHDEIGQTLTAVTIQAERAADGTGADPSAEFHRIAEAVRTSLDDVRRIARELRPEALDDLGLVSALMALCTRMGAQGQVRIERRLSGGLGSLDPQTELVIYRVAQESLTNVIRHAQASKAVVSLEAEDDAVVLRVRDDGRGLPSELPAGTAGLGGMRERALLVGGKLTISSRPDEGTEVRLAVPVTGASG